MALNLTQSTRNLSTQNVIEPNLILEIEGVNGVNGRPILFGVRSVLTIPIFDDDPVSLFDDGLFFDTPAPDKNSRDYIDFKGTTNNITQQILPEKGGAGSVASMSVRLINRNNELTEYFKTGGVLTDIFGVEATLYIGFEGGEHPVDSNEIFKGVINDVTAEHG